MKYTTGLKQHYWRLFLVCDTALDGCRGFRVGGAINTNIKNCRKWRRREGCLGHPRMSAKLPRNTTKHVPKITRGPLHIGAWFGVCDNRVGHYNKVKLRRALNSGVEIKFFVVKWKCQTSTMILSLCIKYSMRELICEVNYTLCEQRIRHVRQHFLWQSC